METDGLDPTASTGEFCIRLPAPHDNIILTSPRLEDVHSILPILNDERVYPWMGLRYPHQHEDAISWLKSAKELCDAAQEELRAEQAAPFFTSQCPVRIIREERPGQECVYLGDCGIQRWRFTDVVDQENRQSLRQENERKPAGDPTIIWTFGYYIAPSHSGRGIMTAAINTLLRWAVVNMNVRHMRATAMEGNEPSIRALEKNNFSVEKTLPDVASRKGVRVGLHILEWKKEAQE